MVPRSVAFAAVCCLALACASAQVIEFEQNGLKYQTLTRRGVTIMFAHMPTHLREFSIIQVAVSNGSAGPYVIRPEDFYFERSDHTVVRASSAKYVVGLLMEKGNRNDVVKLVSQYETGLYGMARMRSTNGYEQRRQAALAEVSSTKLKAAAAASALALVQTKLATGESTDGAVFFPNEHKALGSGHILVRTNTDTFEFNPE